MTKFKIFSLVEILLFLGTVILISCSGDEDTTPSQPEKGQKVFWTARSDVNNISVYVEGQFIGTITVYSPNGLKPECYKTGCVTIERDPGTYSVSANDGDHNWNGTFHINGGSCGTFEFQ